MNAASLQREAETIMASIKAAPLNAAHRVALANVRLLQGQHHKALQQLQVACQADVEWIAQAQLVKMLVQCETARQAVFAGQIQADVMQPAPAWLQLLMQALQGPAADAAAKRQQALDLAPATAGHWNQSSAFDWLADGDERLGPVLEVFTSNRYFWLPVEQIAKLELQPQSGVLDVLWTKVVLTLTDAQIPSITGYIPVHYPNGEAVLADAAYETEWTEGLTADGWQGRGARVWYIDGEPVAMRDVSLLEFKAAA